MLAFQILCKTFKSVSFVGHLLQLETTTTQFILLTVDLYSKIM